MSVYALLLLFLSTLSLVRCNFFDITTTAHVQPSLNAACEGWRLNAEIGNVVGWSVIPSHCESYISHYMLGGQHTYDVDIMAQAAITYASQVELEGDGKDAWVFDIDDTVLSHIAYYSENHFGATPFNRTTWIEWENLAAAPAMKSVLPLFNQLINDQWSVFFLTGRSEVRRNATEENLLHAGFDGWTGLILRQESEDTLPAKVYKSAKRRELEEGGYRIWGNMGDQWSDLTGYATGERVFKVPNPMYYIP